MTSEYTVEEAFDRITTESREIFEMKIRRYGPSFLVLRPRSLIDKLWIKAQRVRTLEEVGDDRQIPDGKRDEYIALINYSIVGLMEIWYREELPEVSSELAQTDPEEVLRVYDKVVKDGADLMAKKNHDYGEAWREMHAFSITDLILDKIVRMKSIADVDSETWDEDLSSELIDILNYSVFYIAKLDSEQR